MLGFVNGVVEYLKLYTSMAEYVTVVKLKKYGKKMVHTRNKGNKAVRNCKEKLIFHGYMTDVVEKTGKFAKQKDLFGLIDLCAIRHDNVLFVQVASNSSQHPHGPMIEFATQYCNEHVWLEQWIWVDYYGFKVFKYYPSGKVECKKLYEGKVYG